MVRKSLILGLLLAAACGGTKSAAKTDPGDDTTGEAGSTGTAGSTGAKAGNSGSAGTSGGSAGTSGGAAGTSGGAAGTSGGAAGTSGTAGTSGGATGSKDGGTTDKDAAVTGTTPDAGPTPDAIAVTGTPYVFTSGMNKGISVFGLDMATGALTAKPGLPGTTASYLAFSPDQKFVYGVAGSAVISMALNAATGGLTKLAGPMPTDPKNEGTHVKVHPNGKWLLEASWSFGKVHVFPIGADGLAGAVAQDLSIAHSTHQISIDPSGKFVFVPCVECNAVWQFKFDLQTGILTPNAPEKTAVAPGADGPRHMAFHPTKPMAYVMCETNGALISYVFDTATGTLTSPIVIPAIGESLGAHIEVHPSGRFVYVSQRTSNKIGIFAVDGITGRLTLVGDENGGGAIKMPRDFTVDPSGTFVVVANKDDGSVTVFRIDLTSGKLTKVGTGASGLGSVDFVGVRFLKP